MFIDTATISAISRVMFFAIVCIALLKFEKEIRCKPGFQDSCGEFFALTGIGITCSLLTCYKLAWQTPGTDSLSP